MQKYILSDGHFSINKIIAKERTDAKNLRTVAQQICNICNSLTHMQKYQMYPTEHATNHWKKCGQSEISKKKVPTEKNLNFETDIQFYIQDTITSLILSCLKYLKS